MCCCRLGLTSPNPNPICPGGHHHQWCRAQRLRRGSLHTSVLELWSRAQRRGTQAPLCPASTTRYAQRFLGTVCHCRCPQITSKALPAAALLQGLICPPSFDLRAPGGEVPDCQCSCSLAPVWRLLPAPSCSLSGCSSNQPQLQATCRTERSTAGRLQAAVNQELPNKERPRSCPSP